jgi:hypothetical protein
MWPFHDFLHFMEHPEPTDIPAMDALVAHVRAISGRTEFADDFSIVEFRFGG